MSVSGPVTQVPRVDITTISLQAVSAIDQAPQQIQDDIAVTVKYAI